MDILTKNPNLFFGRRWVSERIQICTNVFIFLLAGGGGGGGGLETVSECFCQFDKKKKNMKEKKMGGGSCGREGER